MNLKKSLTILKTGNLGFKIIERRIENLLEQVNDTSEGHFLATTKPV